MKTIENFTSVEKNELIIVTTSKLTYVLNESDDQPISNRWIYSQCKKFGAETGHEVGELLSITTMDRDLAVNEMKKNECYFNSKGMGILNKKVLLTKENLPELVGKRIKWEAPIYKHNLGHYGYGLDGGICKILEVDLHNRRPITALIEEGANIDYAFIELVGSYISFSDYDRIISFEEL
jgi:hypothetical protein